MEARRGSVVLDLTEDDGDIFEPTHSSQQPLSDFLPVGALVVHTSNASITHWSEIFDLAALSSNSLPEQLALALKKLLTHRLIRVFADNPCNAVLRVYILPSHAAHPRQKDHKVVGHLFTLLKHVDVSPPAWEGHPTVRQRFNMWASEQEGSLYYLFNHLPSPNPTLDGVKSYFHREAMSQLLDCHSQLPGLETILYPYQRRSAAQMLQRECEERLELDPRLEQRVAVDGTTYFYAPWEVAFTREPPFFESCKGGILAETMGLGKTVICIALILATRGYLPRMPAPYDQETVRPQIASLVDMAISAINRHSAPWSPFFDKHEDYTGEHMGHCIDLMRQSVPSYQVPVEPARSSRNTILPAPRKLILAATTLVVVPRNLLSQWKAELEKHTTPGKLNTLVSDDNSIPLPPPEQLALYDLVLFSRPRFEHEQRDGSDLSGRRMSRNPVSCDCPYIGASRTRNCVCIRPDDVYSSPLKALHVLRIIIDEGHGMAAENTRIATVASKLVEASHRWVVSGTPAKDLIGVEMDLIGPVSHSSSPVPLSTSQADSQYESDSGCSLENTEALRRDALLLSRKAFVIKDERDGAIRSIGSLVSNFLKIKPWSSGADWSDHFFRHEMTRPRSRSYSAYSKCLHRTLQSIVVKTRIEDVDVDINLPPLSHEIVRLSPSFHDKLTVNAFIFVLTANAVTSERKDVDYIFHKKSGKERAQLLSNLRASAFHWTGFSPADMETAIKETKVYLKKNKESCSKQDRKLLRRCLKQAKIMMGSEAWKSLASSHEVGMFVQDWPVDSSAFWSFDKTSDTPTSSLLCGASQLIMAQDHVNQRATALDPAEGLSGVGISVMSHLRPQSSATETGVPGLVKAGASSSSLAANQMRIRRPLSTKPQRQSRSIKREDMPSAEATVQDVELPVQSALRSTKIIGTTSSKLSYLLSRIEEFYREEKILVFYDSDNTAYYIAQSLEVLHIDYLIYAKSLAPDMKSDYIVRFNEKPEHRVLLMDIGQAAYGLNISSASRIFFVNPVNRPSIEAQALKRAHRIGQTRAVHAETLILKGTIEEEIFERARKMSRADHQVARELDDDDGIRSIIQSAQPMPTEEANETERIAVIDKTQPLFARPGWAKWKKSALENSSEGGVAASRKRKRKRKRETKDAAEAQIHDRKRLDNKAK